MLFCFLIWCAVKSMHQAQFIQLRNHNKRAVQCNCTFRLQVYTRIRVWCCWYCNKQYLLVVIVSGMGKRSLIFLGRRCFITVFTKARYWTLSWAISIHQHSHNVSLEFCRLCLGRQAAHLLEVLLHFCMHFIAHQHGKCRLCQLSCLFLSFNNMRCVC